MNPVTSAQVQTDGNRLTARLARKQRPLGPPKTTRWCATRRAPIANSVDPQDTTTRPISQAESTVL